ncbi:MAG: 16S rRNA (adenine(1518)-N(6)/adenine(1519)-N(6))-dimethyltransferase RsmA [Eubacteriales bacterium]|nr:16S rRNA (adenine(1518)-N(6)/adenine(1519)-N(6))-dimethyltransferase RsmA [Eubacteriales bacterium]
MNLAQTKALLSRFNIQPTRSLGQNFLVDERVVSRISDLAELTPEDLVIEIGPGLGHLTVELAPKAGRVIAIEIDRHVLPALDHNLASFDTVLLIHGDALNQDLKQVCQGWSGPVKVVANLPYYVTTDLMLKIMTELPFCQSLTLMMQKEAAERIMAPIGSKGYSPVGIIAASIGTLHRVLSVGRGSYFPQPHVDSVVLQLKPHPTPLVAAQDLAKFGKFLHVCFHQRRKTLYNNLAGFTLAGSGKITPELWTNLIETLPADRNVRAESLTPTQFAKLYYSIIEISKPV